MEIIDLYLQSQAHKIISLDRSRDMLSHAYMLECSDRFLLQHYALSMAQEIFCLSEKTPCCTCNNCNKVAHSNMVDLKIFPTSDKTLTVDDIVEVVSDCYIRPMDAKYKVYILKAFDLCTVQAQNKILKTLEEAPKNVIFILTCTNPSMVLATIASRAKKIDINLLDDETVCQYLKDIGCEHAELISNMAGGRLSTALKLAKNKDAENIVGLCFDVLLNLNASSDVLEFSSKILAYKKDIHFLLNTMIAVLRDIARNDNGINFKNKSKYIEALSTRYSKLAIRQIVGIILDMFEKLDFNGNLNILVDNLLLKILEVKFLCQK